MIWLNRILQRRRLDRDLDRELRFHVEEETRRLETIGLGPAEGEAPMRSRRLEDSNR